MAKLRDFTDYRLAIYGAAEHQENEIHLRFLPKKKNEAKTVKATSTTLEYDSPILKELPTNADVTAIKYNGFKILFESQRDCAYLTKRAAWPKWDSRHPILSLKEIFRVKKIGYTIYFEPCDHKCSTCPHNTEPDYICPTEVEAWHHSKIRQPSGHLRAEPIEYVKEDGRLALSYTEYTTPYMLKVKVENRLYRNQMGTVKYGIARVFKMSWKILLIIGIVAVVAVLFLSGMIPGVGK